MFSKLFSRKKEVQPTLLLAPLTGKAVNLEEVPDPVFSQKIAGDGLAIDPTEGVLVAPVDAKVVHLFNTGHAIGLQTADGAEILMHIGIDTVNLNGEGFSAKVTTGQDVKAGDTLIEFDLDIIKKAGYPAITPIIITNSDAVESMKQFVGASVTRGQEKVLEVTLKA
ncbi:MULTISPECIES: PTS sugar transporter subunit IIA [Brevibacillus]|uniref:PTS sugar transporter subunit IIA n=1 Tax=Brevibacillus TaxID=55080 RepID=UPI00036169EA|nr:MULTISPECIES: PTS glucose transporter subunit IIA [Brevibacillus]ATO48797.1 PTS glucose transporter subunit IIA [Brevibacillus laterosporus DSM 25]AYB41171.1 PTS glucose transporter subunit IIA [Brevibacillus laterosporus]MBG9772864.1 PTS glucose transporter subunit IIA [Brevibacillus laterosporus]MBG9786673.1 PTS glucose transporter subunit IIA [Brevibacillus laterosporus]MBG9797664.1 PTS glucose transporter subunit IIA [Brevibacillus laterosporus]